MTTTYDSKNQAFQMGAAYLGYKTQADINKALAGAVTERTEICNPLVMMLGNSSEAEEMKKKFVELAAVVELK